jgi:apolipoprotein N-acyltransferase
LPEYHNSAYLLEADGTLEGPYRKQRLFPFSEQNPLEGLLRFGTADYRLLPGRNERPLTARLRSNGETREIKIGIAICYEDLWGSLMRSSAVQGAELFVALSNDSWFLRSHAAAQHHLLASFRAVELRRSLVRATTDGVSGVINPAGLQTHFLQPFVAGHLHATVVLYPGTSLYRLVGDIPLLAISLACVLLCVVGTLKRRVLCGRSYPQ